MSRPQPTMNKYIYRYKYRTEFVRLTHFRPSYQCKPGRQGAVGPPDSIPTRMYIILIQNFEKPMPVGCHRTVLEGRLFSRKTDLPHPSGGACQSKRPADFICIYTRCYMLWLQPHKCYHCCKTQDAPQHVSASVPIMEDLARCRPKGRPIEPEPLTVADLSATVSLRKEFACIRVCKYVCTRVCMYACLYACKIYI